MTARKQGENRALDAQDGKNQKRQAGESKTGRKTRFRKKRPFQKDHRTEYGRSAP